MKLIEKLAREYSDTASWDPFIEVPAFEAGFRAAREMAVKEARNYPTTNDEGEPCNPYGLCSLCGGGPEVATFLEKLGEEEVK